LHRGSCIQTQCIDVNGELIEKEYSNLLKNKVTVLTLFINIISKQPGFVHG